MPDSAAEHLFRNHVTPALGRLGWGEAALTSVRRIHVDATGAAFRLERPESTPLAVTVVHEGAEETSLRWAGNIGYNIGSRLVLAASPSGSALLTPYVVRNESGPTAMPAEPAIVRQETGDPENSVFRVGIGPGDVDAAARKAESDAAVGYHVRVPIADALMQHLVRIRERILREEEIEEAPLRAHLASDERLLRLIGSLIFARILEDSGDWVASVRLDAVLDSGELSSGLRRIRDELRRRFGKAVALPTDLRWRSEDTVRDLIRGLYWDASQRAHIDFRLLDEDILARLYQEYLQYLLTDRAKREQLRLLGREDRISLRVRRDLGIYYTPRSVADLLLAEAVRHLATASTPPLVLEPACGAAAFMRPVATWMMGQWPGATASEIAARLVGMDLDPRAIELTRQSLARTFIRHHGEAPDLRLVTDDFLDPSQDTKDLLQGAGFDLIIGNPPFLSHAMLQRSYPARAARYRTLHEEAYEGETNLAAPFLTHAMSLLRPGGILAMVVPRRLLRGSNSRVRRTLIRAAELLTVVDFGQEFVFDGTIETTALVVLRRRPSGAGVGRRTSAQAIMVSKFRDVLTPLYTDALRATATRAETDAVLVKGEVQAEGGSPWLILSKHGRQVYERITTGSVPFDEIAEVTYGVDMMTGRGKTLLFRSLEDDPESAEVLRVHSEHLKEAVLVERQLLRRAVKAGDVDRYRLRGGDPLWVLHPFRDNGTVIPEHELLGPETNYPNAATVIRRLEPELRQGSGHRSTSAWYAPGGTRPNSPWHRPSAVGNFGSSLLIGPRFSRIPKVAPIPMGVLPTGSLITFAIRSGFSEHGLRLLAFMNSSLVNWLSYAVTATFSVSGHADRRKATFMQIRFPREFFSNDTTPIHEAFGLLASPEGAAMTAELLAVEKLVDDWVYSSLGIGSLERDVIRDEEQRFSRNELYKSVAQRVSDPWKKRDR